MEKGIAINISYSESSGIRFRQHMNDCGVKVTPNSHSMIAGKVDGEFPR
jgi:hypothetical protein